MSVTRATTPTFLLQFNQQGLDLTTAHNVYVTFRSGAKTITKTGEDLEVAAQSISVYLRQQDTIGWKVGNVMIQANWTSADGSRTASEIVGYKIDEQLLNKVVT